MKEVQENIYGYGFTYENKEARVCDNSYRGKRIILSCRSHERKKTRVLWHLETRANWSAYLGEKELPCTLVGWKSRCQGGSLVE